MFGLLFWSIFVVNLVRLSTAHQCFELRSSSNSNDTDRCNQCEYGSECIFPISRTNKNLTCKCIDACYSYGDSVDSRTVCGEDGNVYSSICHLQKYSCESKKEIKIKYIGKCDPCKGVNCLPNQTCMIDPVSRHPICQCDDHCESVPFEPVCATNGQTYANECILKVQACKQRRELKVLSRGECKDQQNDRLCDEANCSNNELCEIDMNGRASCVCPDCLPTYMPVCGSNGVTYDSMCELKKYACITKQEILAIHYGLCGQQGECDNYQCNFSSICMIDSITSQPYCECEKECSLEYHPICANDGLTYTNECILKRTACLKQRNIEPLYQGACTACLQHKCDLPYSTCKINMEKNQTAECICLFDCDQKGDQVCGGDPQTGIKQIYPNECELKKKSCETNTELQVIADLSICELCKQVYCKYSAHCHLGKCVCPTDCPKEVEPVCSNLDITFANECELRRTACMNSRDEKTGNINYEKLDNYTILFYGDCNKQQEPNEEIKLIPVLSKSSILLSNQMIGSYMTICNENTCKFGGRCYYNNENGLPSCLCSFDCQIQKDDKKVCGHHGRLFLNDCKLQEEACLIQQKIDTLPLKNCLINKNFSVCNGTMPQFDKSSGRFIDCNRKSLFFRECSPEYTCLHHRKVIPSIKTLLTFKDQDHFCCSAQEIDQAQFNSLNELFDSKLIEQHQQSNCDCNKLGSESPTRCDSQTGQCECKKGVDGLKCNRCKIGFYGFHKLSQGNNGCLPCLCNKNGSLREDCEQTSGLCICKIGVSGMKCDVCEGRKKLTSSGCVDEALLKTHKKNCASLRCRFGAVCKEIGVNRSQCVCNYACRKRFEIDYQRRMEREDEFFDLNEHYHNLSIFLTEKRETKYKSKYLSRLLCGSDQNTHLNECEMRIHACKMQRKIVKIKDGQCPPTKELNNNLDISTTVTQTPVRRSTLEKELDSRDFYESIDETGTTESSLTSNLYTNMYEEAKPNFNPMFKGKSFIRLSRLESSSYLKLEIELVAFSDRGIIFYNGQSNKGVGDFISLTLNNAYFEYRFNLGSGVSTLRSKEKVIKYVPTKITLIKDFKKGVLIVNDQEEVSCISEGNWKSLDLDENFFLGYVKSDYERIYENLNNVRTGFVGCLMRLELAKNEGDLKNIELSNDSSFLVEFDEKATTSVLLDYNSSMSNRQQIKMKILETDSIDNCSSLSKNEINFCLKHNSCTKGSICVNLINNTFDCICPFGNERCTGFSKNDSFSKLEQESSPVNNVYALDFWGESWIKSRNLLLNVARSFSIEIWFLTRSKDGLIIYSQKNKKSDFLCLNIKNNRLEFIFDLGSKIPNISGVVKIESKELINLNIWHKVRINRLDDYATMQINDGVVYSDHAKGNLTELNLDDSIYIGGMADFNESNVEANLTSYLNGAIQRIIINGEHFVGSTLLTRPSTERTNISSYLGPGVIK